MVASSLPPELLANVFGHLSPPCLADASRVCRTWQTIAFPLLHETVYLCLTVHLERFVERIRSEDAGSQSSVVTHLKGLVFDIEYFRTHEKEIIKDSDLANLNEIIPRLINLKYFSWNLMFAPRSPETFRLFQTECPKLDSVHIWIMEDVDFYTDQYKSLFRFNNLSYFSLSIWNMPPMFDEDLLDPLTSLLARCPNLSSLLLDLNGEFTYSPAKVTGALGDHFVFPHLRRFHAKGKEKPNWTQFFEKPGSNPFRQFLIRHPGIEDLALGYVAESCHSGHIPPTEIAELLPSLKCFEGPAFLFKPLVLSSLADQIEELIIVDKSLIDDVSLTELYDQVPTLPRLRKFGIWAKKDDIDEDEEEEEEEEEDSDDDINDESVLVNILRTIVNAAEHLEEIEIHLDVGSTAYAEIMELIAKVRGLRSVTLSDSFLSGGTDNDDDEEELEWDTVASNLRRTCPQLRMIYGPIEKFDKDNRVPVWEL